MPLHLLGKKSWNVYNPANIARVKRDEAEAQARDEAEAKRQQQLDAERRLAILRGETPPALPPPSTNESSPASSTPRKNEHRRDDDPTAQFRGAERRKRKRHGEDDTDFEMRVARERADAAATNTLTRPNNSAKTSDAPIVDSKGHISLFPENQTDGRGPRNGKNEEAEAEATKKRREIEDLYTMRFSNAGGRGNALLASEGPWYTSAGTSRSRGSVEASAQLTGKDVWGNEDPKRKARDAARVVANDPLAMMKKGAAKVRDVERERRALNEEKARELKELHREQRRREKRRHRRDDVDELEGFSLDANSLDDDNRRRHRDRRDEYRHHRRSDQGDRLERHHSRSYDRGHEKSHRHDGGRGRDSVEQEQHSSGHSRRQLSKTDHY
ncbi:hypothetical protein GGR50DRAFT_503548 [Xylaria sp. CBS 124048]|nr:hypothetical protein GGR50DRAFT_503548 [Xylaria sp. CBS 124048]